MYKDLKAIYDKTRLDGFAMAVTYVVDIGYRNAKELTDKEIADTQGNGLMTQGFVQNLMKLAREIANAVENPTEIIQFCDAMGVFETRCYTTGECLNRTELEKMVRELINYVLYDDMVSFKYDKEEEGIEALADYLDVDIDDIESILERRF